MCDFQHDYVQSEKWELGSIDPDRLMSIWRGMAELLATHSDPQAREVRLYSVTVSEKGAQSATYMEVDD